MTSRWCRACSGRCSALLTNDITCLCIPLHARSRSPTATQVVKSLEKLFVLEQNPLLAGTTVNHLLDMAGIAREVTLERAKALFDETDVPAVYYVLSGIV